VVFLCFFLSCKANARVKLAKTGHGPHSSTLFVIWVVRLLFVLFCELFVCKCVLPPGDNPIAVNKYININISNSKRTNSVSDKLTFWHQSFTFKSNHQPDATIFQFIILTFVYSSTRFGRFFAHHQELNDCSGSLWFYLRIVVTAMLCSWSGRPASPTTNTARLSPRFEGKTRGCHCSH
jgi:hypothetical protein